MTNEQTEMKVSNLTPEDALRVRVLQAKSKLPKGTEYTGYYVDLFGEKTAEEITRVRAVWNLRFTDEAITDNIEKLVDYIKGL